MRIFTIAFAALAVLIVGGSLLGSFYTVDEGERAVVTFNGKVTGVSDPGFHFKLPIVNDTTKISIRSQVATYDELAAYSKDQQSALMRISVNYSIPAGDVTTIYTRYGDAEGAFSKLVTPKVMQQVKNVFGRYNAVSAVQDRAQLNADIQESVTAAVTGPILIEAIQIENIDFSDVYEQSIEQRMLAEVEVQKVRQNVEREKATAEITVVQAQAQADSALAVAEAQAKATRLAGDAEAAAIDARGKALRDNPNVVSLVQAERWDGKLPTTMVPDSTTPFMRVQ